MGSAGGAFFGMDVTANPRLVGFCAFLFFDGIPTISGVQVEGAQDMSVTKLENLGGVVELK